MPWKDLQNSMGHEDECARLTSDICWMEFQVYWQREFVLTCSRRGIKCYGGVEQNSFMHALGLAYPSEVCSKSISHCQLFRLGHAEGLGAKVTR